MNIADRAAHACEWDVDAAGKGDHDALDDAKAEYIVEGLTRSRRHQLELAKARAQRGIGAGGVEPASQASARPVRVNEEGAYARGLGFRVEPRIHTSLRLIASIECASRAPAAGRGRRLER